jgi:hypothetical protein
VFKYFSGSRLALIIGSPYRRKSLGFVAGGVLVEEFEGIGVISKLF